MDQSLKRKIRRIFSTAFYRLIPESTLRRRLRCLYRNLFRGHPFSIDYRRGRHVVVMNGRRMTFESSIDIYLELSTAVKGYLEQYQPRPGDIVVDGGAFTGVFTVILSRMVGSGGRVIAFEPDREAYPVLLKNLAANDASNVVPVNKGLLDVEGDFPFCPGTGGSSRFIYPDSAVAVSVPSVRLDDELAQMNIRKVDYIKMDVEGSEVKALAGAERTLKGNDVKVAVASYHFVDGKKTFRDVERLLSNLGYEVFTSFPLHLTTYGRKTEPGGPNREHG